MNKTDELNQLLNKYNSFDSFIEEACSSPQMMNKLIYLGNDLNEHELNESLLADEQLRSLIKRLGSNFGASIIEGMNHFGLLESNVPAPTEPDEEGAVELDGPDVEDIKKETNDFFFKNIIFFTNERNPQKNKTLNNLVEAIKDKDITLTVFVADEVSYKAEDDYILIKDSKTKYIIKEQSNIDTICIARLGAQDNEQCVECIKEIQNWGIFTLNPIMAAKRASNKYTSAVLMERYDIPQPKFTLINKSDIESGDDSLVKKLALIYPEVKDLVKSGSQNDKDKLDSLEYVVKILNGHGGTGVFMVTGKTILGILQAIFAIDEDRELLLQKKEDADGGDIRVHVITSRTKQCIIAAMKRKKLEGDFRSNVSLGATAEPVELTDEQTEIALKVAKISGMPWCAVDIMPLKSGSDPEIGDNVVLEYNASPGTDGISEVIGMNFVSVLLNSINDINELQLSQKSIGYIEPISITFDDDNKMEFDAKFDTGNGAKASTLGVDQLVVNENDNTVTFKIRDKEFTLKLHGTVHPIVGQVTEERLTVILPEIQVGTRKLTNVEFGIVDNRNKSTRILINRDVMRKMGYVIDPSLKNSCETEG